MDMTRTETESSIEYRAGREAAVYYNNNESATDASFGAFESGYIKGATEQKTIDIDRADKWLRTHLPRVISNYPYGDGTTDMLNEDMRAEFREAMGKEK